MDDLITLSKLIDLAEEIGISVRRAPAMGDLSSRGGGYVRVGKREMLFLDPAAPVSDQLTIAIEALQHHPEMTDRFLPPQLRALLDASEEA
ncbi:MAG: hypothetical protein HN909_08995 [Phycisphaerales bacterium]|jgi:hypothetical protein|nr:hypothetical protein [Phycisphaerales bacterium]MBT7171887.1 hypothetical protein [Phycisphaerales bacterium]